MSAASVEHGRGPTYRHVAVRMADEGIPIAAIARVLKRRFDDVESTLKEAIEASELIDLPRSEWSRSVTKAEREPERVRRPVSESIINDMMVVIGVSAQLARVLAVLLRRDVAMKPTIIAALYQYEGAVNPKIVDVLICHLRKKLRPLDINIETVWGRGYRLDRENRQRLLDYIKEHRS